MPDGLRIDWYRHYTQHKKVAPLCAEDFERQWRIDQPFLDMLARHVPPAGRILECGCGLARTAMSMAHAGYQITALDHDSQILEQARINACQLALSMDFLQGDFFRLGEALRDRLFDGATHQGVLEHYDRMEIHAILAQQLGVSPVVVCSVPIESVFNWQYFQDSLYRNLWPESIWREILCPVFQVVESRVARQRTDNLIMAIRRDF
ncbi:MAG: class I SAM-dependent methyltransferase [Pseudomonadota bacterium]